MFCLQFQQVKDFTFHNVSINTDIEEINETTDQSLHSTMFLLIHMLTALAVIAIIFTFHNVSINTKITADGICGKDTLYIPQCFY